MMFDKQKDIDAVIVATPDHAHAIIGLAAIQRGKHVYIQKPMAHSVQEARLLTEAARKHKVVTQMGNQGHSGDGARMICEWIWDGAIGAVREVHAWTNRPGLAAGDRGRPPQRKAAACLIHSTGISGSDRPRCALTTPPIIRANGGRGGILAPARWETWAAISSTPPFWALKLKYPTSVEGCISTYWNDLWKPCPPKNENYPRSTIARFKFPAREDMPEVELTWWDGGMMPPRPEGLEPGRRMGDDDGGVLFIGDKGSLICGCYGRSPRLIPDDKNAGVSSPEGDARANPWRRERPREGLDPACRGGKPASSNFDFSGPLSEMVLMGNLAVRYPNRKLLWDGEKMEVTNDSEANSYVRRHYREGWTLMQTPTDLLRFWETWVAGGKA